MPNAKEKKRPRRLESSSHHLQPKNYTHVGASSPSHLAYLKS